MKFFENASKSEEKQKESEVEQLRIQLEAERQKSLEKRLDELILVGKAIYTIIRKDQEERKTAYENLENAIQASTNEIIQNQEKAVKIMLAYGREDNQKAITAVKEEFVKVQEASAKPPCPLGAELYDGDQDRTEAGCHSDQKRPSSHSIQNEKLLHQFCRRRRHHQDLLPHHGSGASAPWAGGTGGDLPRRANIVHPLYDPVRRPLRGDVF